MKVLSKHLKMSVPDYSQILTAHNKDKWVNIAEDQNIPVPKTFPITKYISDPGLIEELTPYQDYGNNFNVDDFH